MKMKQVWKEKHQVQFLVQCIVGLFIYIVNVKHLNINKKKSFVLISPKFSHNFFLVFIILFITSWTAVITVVTLLVFAAFDIIPSVCSALRCIAPISRKLRQTFSAVCPAISIETTSFCTARSSNHILFSVLICYLNLSTLCNCTNGCENDHHKCDWKCGYRLHFVLFLFFPSLSLFLMKICVKNVCELFDMRTATDVKGNQVCSFIYNRSRRIFVQLFTLSVLCLKNEMIVVDWDATQKR